MQTELFQSSPIYKHRLSGQLMKIIRQTENIATCEFIDEKDWRYLPPTGRILIKNCICKVENLEIV